MISVVVPLYNEQESVGELHRRILAVLKQMEEPFEIIFVDDGSRDATFSEIQKLSPVTGMRLRRNYGQTAAFGAGIGAAAGDIVVTLDGDLENQPEDIPALVEKLTAGYDVVSGWRKKRWQEKYLTRRLPSLAANWLISRTTGVYLHDHGCNLRAYRAGVFDGVAFNGEMHRMLAAYLGMHGAKVVELPVTYIPRKYGRSKYGISRTFRVLLDVLAFHFFKEYATRPMHFFGYAGLISMAVGAATFFWALYLRFSEGLHFNRTPLPILVGVFFVVGFQFILMGLLAEILLRSRREKPSQTYDIGECIQN